MKITHNTQKQKKKKISIIEKIRKLTKQENNK